MKDSLRKFIPFRFASAAIIVINSLVILFHLLVVSGVVPFDIVWGGKIQSKTDMYVFEGVSILINLFLIGIVLKKGRNPDAPNTVVNVILWVFVVIFALNTAGNLAAEKRIEMILATPLTFILAVLCWRVAIEKSSVEPADENLPS